MKAILQLAVQSIWARRLTLAVALFAIALAAALLLAVERLRSDARASFMQSVSGVDLVVGARGGELQLILYAVFHTGRVASNLSWASVDLLATHPAVAWIAPLSLGDAHRGFPVVGTTRDYFAHMRHASGQPFVLAAGQPFAGVFDAVLGSEVARRLNYQLGERITLAHGSEAGAAEHADKPFTVTGILAATGTPADRSVHVSLEAISALHLDWAGGAPLPGVSIPAELVAKFDLQPREVTAVLVGLKNRADVFRLQRQLNGHRGEALSAVMPGVALDELWQTLAVVERSFLVVSGLVVVIGLAGLSATLLAGLNERRRELAILRALGAAPRDIFLMLAAEGLLVTLLGVLAGVALLAAGTALLAPLARDFGVQLAAGLPRGNELVLLLTILVVGLLASLVPGWRAWRLSLADGLTPRS